MKFRRNTNHWSRFLRNRYHVKKQRRVPTSGTTWRLTKDRALGEAIRGIIIIYCLIRNLYHYFNKVKKKSLDTYLVKVPKCLAISDSQSFVSYSGSTDQRLRKIKGLFVNENIALFKHNTYTLLRICFWWPASITYVVIPALPSEGSYLKIGSSKAKGVNLATNMYLNAFNLEWDGVNCSSAIHEWHKSSVFQFSIHYTCRFSTV